MQEIKLKVLKLRQPIGDFYISSIPASDLCSIAKADIRRLERDEKREFETYLGIQRPLSKKRVQEISQYVKTYDASFPTAVVIAVDGKCAFLNDKGDTLTLKAYTPTTGETEDAIPFTRVARILDGQHRVASLEHYAEAKDFDINVAIFIEMDIAQQAHLFATVNLAQTKVNKSLVYDLAGLAKAPSPYKTCHKVAIELDGQPNSPFYQKIKRLGTATKIESNGVIVEVRFDETLTQATVVESLKGYISANPTKDRDALFRGEKLELANKEELKIRPLRNLFIHGKDIEIAKIIWSYFAAIKERWPEAWETRKSGTMLYRTNGFKGFMKFFGLAYNSLVSHPGEVLSKDAYKNLFAKVTLRDEDFTTEKFLPGGAGELDLYNRLKKDTNLG